MKSGLPLPVSFVFQIFFGHNDVPLKDLLEVPLDFSLQVSLNTQESKQLQRYRKNYVCPVNISILIITERNFCDKHKKHLQLRKVKAKRI